MLTKDENLYVKAEAAIQSSCRAVHAVYEPDGGDVYGGCYCAAVELFQPGMTFRLYFRLSDSGEVLVEHLERWWMG